VGQSSRITPTRSFLTDYGADQLTQISFEFNADAQTQKKLIGDGLFFSTSDDVSRGITLDVSPNGQLIVASPYLLKWGNTKNYLDGQWHAVIIQAWNGHRLNAFIDGVLLPPMANSLGLSPSHVIHYEVGEIKLYPYYFFRNFQAENTRLVKN
jgi:hypothetical protein